MAKEDPITLHFDDDDDTDNNWWVVLADGTLKDGLTAEEYDHYFQLG